MASFLSVRKRILEIFHFFIFQKLSPNSAAYSDQAAILPTKSRVARFFMVQHTKMGKRDQIFTK
jgi:hypothetical protein